MAWTASPAGAPSRHRTRARRRLPGAVPGSSPARRARRSRAYRLVAPVAPRADPRRGRAASLSLACSLRCVVRGCACRRRPMSLSRWWRNGSSSARTGSRSAPIWPDWEGVRGEVQAAGGRQRVRRGHGRLPRGVPLPTCASRRCAAAAWCARRMPRCRTARSGGARRGARPLVPHAGRPAQAKAAPDAGAPVGRQAVAGDPHPGGGAAGRAPAWSSGCWACGDGRDGATGIRDSGRGRSAGSGSPSPRRGAGDARQQPRCSCVAWLRSVRRERPRARELGSRRGVPSGPLNAITDVAGVRVGTSPSWKANASEPA